MLGLCYVNVEMPRLQHYSRASSSLSCFAFLLSCFSLQHIYSSHVSISGESNSVMLGVHRYCNWICSCGRMNSVSYLLCLLNPAMALEANALEDGVSRTRSFFRARPRLQDENVHAIQPTIKIKSIPATHPLPHPNVSHTLSTQDPKPQGCLVPTVLGIQRQSLGFKPDRMNRSLLPPSHSANDQAPRKYVFCRVVPEQGCLHPLNLL